MTLGSKNVVKIDVRQMPGGSGCEELSNLYLNTEFFLRMYLGSQFRCCRNSLLLHRSIWIARWGNALQQIRTQKTFESTKPLILCRVDKLVYNQ